jgi:hypothetical protein
MALQRYVGSFIKAPSMIELSILFVSSSCQHCQLSSVKERPTHGVSRPHRNVRSMRLDLMFWGGCSDQSVRFIHCMPLNIAHSYHSTAPSLRGHGTIESSRQCLSKGCLLFTKA